jgi:hypothetical protein
VRQVLRDVLPETGVEAARVLLLAEKAVAVGNESKAIILRQIAETWVALGRK